MRSPNTLNGRGRASRSLKTGLLALILGWNLTLSATPQITVGFDGTNVNLGWASTSNDVYEVESRSDAASGSWGPAATLIAASNTTTWSAGPPAANRQIYRVFFSNVPFSPPETAFEPPERAPAEPCGCNQCSAPWVGLPSVYLFSGEFHHSAVDLRIKGRGLDLVWARKYRSQVPVNTAQGIGWDYSYNLYIVQPDPTKVEVHDGNTRADTYLKQLDDSYALDELFRRGVFSGGLFVLSLADGGIWEFLPLTDPTAPGKINRIIDRNGNTLNFTYIPGGLLSAIADALGHVITVAYTNIASVERIASVTDHAGRTVRYEYYRSGDAGGSAGDLKSVTSPPVVGTPQGNDFPLGKTTTYTYSKGFSEERLNHNLLTITDPNGWTILRNSYGTNSNGMDFEMDKVVKQVWGGQSPTVKIHYAPQIPAAGNQFAILKTIVNDPVGNVSEYFFDARNRCVLQRAFTGRADATLTTTERLNRPANPLRGTDPAYFETRLAYNSDSLPTLLVSPNGNSVSNCYERLLNPVDDPRARGNLRVRTKLPGPLGADQSALVEQFQYGPVYGGCCGVSFVTNHIDAAGHVTRLAYDSFGNRTNTLYAVSGVSESWAYNTFGQVTAHILPANGSGYRRRDEFQYDSYGYLQQQIEDATYLRLTNFFGNDSLGNVLFRTDPAGRSTLYTLNALGQVVREESPELAAGIRYEKLIWYDANDNVVRMDLDNRDEYFVRNATNSFFTTIQEYDSLNHLVRLVQEKGGAQLASNVLALADIPAGDRAQFIVTEYEYDADGNQTLVRQPEAVNGHQPASLIQRLYDERNLLYREVRAPGNAAQSTTQTDYDGNGNIVRTWQGLEDTGAVRSTTSFFDGFNRLVSRTDPMGNLATNRYDPDGNRLNVRVFGELTDVPGGAGNVRLSETAFTYDAMHRQTRSDKSFFDPQTQLPLSDGLATARIYYAPNSQVIYAADDNSHTNQFAYDTANRRAATADPAGNSTAYTYDSAGNLTLSTDTDVPDLVGPPENFNAPAGFDALNRRLWITDNGGNTHQFAYDSRDNLVLMTDGAGNQTRYVYDGLNRLVTTIRDMNSNGPSETDPADIVTRQAWDDNSRLISQTDANGHTTQYAYDPLDRQVTVTLADATTVSSFFDVHNNLVAKIDANGSAVTNAYDLLNRVTNVTAAPGPGVFTGTTYERYQYDGLSRAVRAEDNDSLVTRSYDSLSNVTRESQQLLPGGPINTLTASFDGVGNKLTNTYPNPSGRVISATYDPLNRKRSLAQGTSLIASNFFIGPHRLERRNFGNGNEMDWAYDNVRQPTSIVTKKGGAYLDTQAFTWNATHSKASSQSGAVPFLPHHEFAYDAARRLTNSQSTLVGMTGYSLDGAGNRLLVTGGGGGGGVYTMSAVAPEPADYQVNQYTLTPFGSRAYDHNGNLLTNGNHSYVYDYRDQMVQHTCPGTNTTFAYDALGRCTQKIVNGQTTRYLYDAWQAIEERDAANTVQATYVYGVYVDDIVSMRRGAANYYYHADDLNSVKAVTDDAGNVVERYDYEDSGKPSFYSGSGGPLSGSAIGNHMLFNGHRYDTEEGLYYYRARSLDPNVGRFVTRDPRGAWYDDAALGNAYTYAGNNPATYVDPFGYGIGKAGVKADLTFHVDFCKGDYKLTGSFWAGICVNVPFMGCQGPQVSLKGTIKNGNISQLKLFNCGQCASSCLPGWLQKSPLSWLQNVERSRSVSFEIWILECTAEATVSLCQASVGVSCSANLLEQIPGSSKVIDALKKVGASAEIGVEGSFSLSVCAAKAGGVTTGSADGEIKGFLKVGWGL